MKASAVCRDTGGSSSLIQGHGVCSGIDSAGRDSTISPYSMSSKRFIKKVPPSGAAPVFKLTLPHRTVHTHLSHLIDSDFEIVTSPDAPTSWQGTIAPRRNKDRSEYTLQGWRLFAEAHRVQPGDQVSFELVSPKRLVVQVISTESTKLANRLGRLNGRAVASPEDEENLRSMAHMEAPEQHEHAWTDHRPGSNAQAEHSQQGVDIMQHGVVRSVGSRQSSSQEIAGQGQPDLQGPNNLIQPGTPKSHLSPLQVGPSTPRNAEMFLQHMQGAWPPPMGAASGHAGILPLKPQLFRTPGALGDGPQRQPVKVGASEETLGWRGEQLGQNSVTSDSRLNFQLLNLNSTIRGLQSDLQTFEGRAKRAEFEAAQMKHQYGELRSALDRQARAVLQAGHALEKLTDNLASPHFLAAADQELTAKVLSLQSEMFTCVEMLKASLMRLLSLDIEAPAHVLHSSS